MSNPNTFMNNYETKVNQLVTLLEELRAMNDWIDQDSTLLTRYFAQADPRMDIVEEDVKDAQGALNQVLFAYDSGSPTQKSFILKMIP